MRAERRADALIAVVAGGAFLAGATLLLHLRFEAGDVYPAYSSLRSDPLGTRALHDSLAALPGLRVERGVTPLDHLEDPAAATVLILGDSPSDLGDGSGAWAMQVAALAGRGARVVVALAPDGGEERKGEKKRSGDRQEDSGEKGGDAGRKKTGRGDHGTGAPGEPAGEPGIPAEPPLPTALERFGVAFESRPLPSGPDGEPGAAEARRVASAALPASLSWHAASVIARPAPEWNVIYARGDDPVLIERRYGRGSLVLSTDAYAASNEALQNEPQPRLLAWLVGVNRRVVFEETHHGIASEPGPADLMRRYGLQGAAAAALVLAGLFLWRAGSRFGPAADPGEGEVPLAGRDAAAGFVSLLRRGLAPNALLTACAAEWSKTEGHARPEIAAEVERLAATAADPLEGYARIGRLLSRPGRHIGERHER